MIERLKDPLLWASWISTILVMIKLFCKIDIDEGSMEYITTAILTILSMLGAINNPTNKKGI